MLGKKVFSCDCTPECTWGVVGEEARGRARMVTVNILSTYCMSDIVPSVLHILCLNLYKQSFEESTIVILQLGKMMHREIRDLARVTQLMKDICLWRSKGFQ